jgi:hypothetical protein
MLVHNSNLRQQVCVQTPHTTIKQMSFCRVKSATLVRNIDRQADGDIYRDTRAIWAEFAQMPFFGRAS